MIKKTERLHFILLSFILMLSLFSGCGNPLVGSFYGRFTEGDGLIHAQKPKITSQPKGASYYVNAAPQALEVIATVSDGGTLSYQWYSNSTNFISGATGPSYYPSTAAIGSTTYHVVITNTIEDNGDGGRKTAEVKSASVTVTVTAIPITLAAVTVPAPEKNGIPQGATGAGNFTVESTIWNPNHNPFQQLTTYKVTVTLNADENYIFNGSTSGTINGYSANLTITNNGKTATLSYQFAQTDSRIITGIFILTPPYNMNYCFGETLVLTGLSVRLTYDDTTTEDVNLSEFASKNISTEPANGIKLDNTVHNNVPITVTAGTYTDFTSLKLVVDKAPGAIVASPTVSSVTNNSITVNALTPPATGQSIEYAISTSSGDVPASLTWQAGRTFSGLSLGTTYYVYARSMGNLNYYAGVPSVSGGILIGGIPVLTLGVENITDGAPELNSNIVIYISGTPGGNPRSSTFVVSLSNPGLYSSIRWEIAGTAVIATTPTFTLNAADERYNNPGGHALILKVDYNGLSYQKTVLFKVEV